MSARPAAARVIAIALVLCPGGVTGAQRAGGPPAVVRDGGRAPETGSGSISGVVLTDDAGAAPVRRATVTLRNTDSSASTVAVTDAAGRFAFSDLPAGRFLVSAAKPAYVSIAYGARAPRSPGLAIALENGQRLADLTIRMARGAVVTGRVVDQLGQPAVGLRVTASERTIVNGVPSYRPGFGSGATVDDRGLYRIYGLAAGTYVIAASSGGGLAALGGAARVTTAEEVQWALRGNAPTPGGRPAASTPPPPRGPGLRYAPVFYPGTTDAAGAVPITLTAGEERSAVDFVVELVPTATVEGAVVRPDGQPASANVQVMALSSSARIPGVFELPPRASVTPDGRFSLSGLGPGHYTVMARAASAAIAPGPLAPAGGRGGGGAPAMDLWAATEIDVAGHDITDVTLRLATGVTVSGRVTTETASPEAGSLAGRGSVRLVAPPDSAMSLGVPPAQIGADGSFTFTGVTPGAYLLSANLTGGSPATPAWTLKSATLGGRDVLDTPLVIAPGQDVAGLVVTFSDRVTELSGSLIDQVGRPAPNHFVVLFSTNPAYWRQQSRWLRQPARPASDGRFSVAGMPAGEYFLAAVTEFEPNEWYTPAFLQQLVPLSLRITLAEGEKKTQDLRLAAN
jgi:hypothetical protein